MKGFPGIRGRWSSFLFHSVLPLLVGVYPACFHFGNNTGIALPADLEKLLLVFTATAVTVYILFGLLGRSEPVQTANAAAAFLVGFHTYGIAFHSLRAWDILQVEHYSLLPLFIPVCLFAAWRIAAIPEKPSILIWRGAVIVVGALTVLNAVKIVSAEAARLPSEPSPSAGVSAPEASDAAREYPDIYYLVFDEMAGFEAVRSYWGYSGIDDFVEFLKQHGFTVAENNHSMGTDTPYEVANRLNFTILPQPSGTSGSYMKIYQDAIADNRAMQILKSLGYTTVAYTELRSLAYPAASPMRADFLFEYPAGTVVDEQAAFDDFLLMVLGNTMAAPWVDRIQLHSPQTKIEQHKNMIFFTLDAVPRLGDIPGPKFVYVHLLLPHVPFLFQADGSLIGTTGYFDWNNYLGQYRYALPLMERLIEGILSAADPSRPTVIILSSDHGARNLPHGGSPTLQEYPEEYKTLIVNAFRFPGCNIPDSVQDMNPINTLPIALNCYFDAKIGWVD